MGLGEAPRDVEAATRFIRESEPLMAFIGYRLVELSQGRACAEFDHTRNVERIGGVLHGGILASVLDETLGMAVLTVNDGADQVTVELKINFLEAGREGPYRVCGQVVRRGGRLVVAEGEVRDRAGRLIAKALGTWYILRREVGRMG
ncbi:MAG: PaaI family thioesterase [Thermoproteus sp.]